MKKAIFAILAVLLCVSFAEAQQVTVVKKKAASCSQTIIRQLNANNGQQFGHSADYAYLAGSFTSTQTSNIKSVSLFGYLADGTPSGTLTVSICTDNSGAPSTSCTTMGTADIATYFLNSTTEYAMPAINIYNATGAAQDGSSLYWIRVQDSSVSAGNSQRMQYLNTGSHEIGTSADGSTWAESDTSAELVYILGTCAYGTAETPVQGWQKSGGAYALGNATRTKMGVGFKAFEAFTPVKLSVPIAKVLNPNGNINAAIYASGGTTPTGSAICTSSADRNKDNTTTSEVWYDFTLSGCTELTAGTEYFAVLETSATNDSSNYFLPSNSTTDGNMDFVGYAGSWSNISANGSMSFVIYK